MEYQEVIRARYSCKKFDGRQISDEQLDSILKAGSVAPTAKNLQEQHIYVVRDTEKLTIIDEATPCRYNAPTVLVVAYDTENVFVYPGGKYSSGIEDAAIVATHLILGAADVRVDSCWVNNFDPDALAEKLGLPKNEKILATIDLGFAAEGAGPLPNHNSVKDLSETVTYL